MKTVSVVYSIPPGSVVILPSRKLPAYRGHGKDVVWNLDKDLSCLEMERILHNAPAVDILGQAGSIMIASA